MFIASKNGHNAVVRALLDGGAAINQAKVRVVGVSGAVVGVACGFVGMLWQWEM